MLKYRSNKRRCSTRKIITSRTRTRDIGSKILLLSPKRPYRRNQHC